MARPVIALLTDFGLLDHYVAAMKGVMLGICPDATFIDISHDIAPQDVLAGALELEAVAPYLPEGTVVIAVVDPGVGSARRGVAVDAGALRLVGPDNGLLTLVGEPARAVELREGRFARPAISRTFEGRDRFAPAAGWLAAGIDLDQFGPRINDLRTLDVPLATRTHHGTIEGRVLRIDRFGNLVTNVARIDLAQIGAPVAVEVAGTTIEPLSGAYADVEAGRLCALIGSTDRLEIAVNGGSAAIALGVSSAGTPVQVRRTDPHDRMRGTA